MLQRSSVFVTNFSKMIGDKKKVINRVTWCFIVQSKSLNNLTVNSNCWPCLKTQRLMKTMPLLLSCFTTSANISFEAYRRIQYHPNFIKFWGCKITYLFDAGKIFFAVNSFKNRMGRSCFSVWAFVGVSSVYDDICRMYLTGIVYLRYNICRIDRCTHFCCVPVSGKSSAGGSWFSEFGHWLWRITASLLISYISWKVLKLVSSCVFYRWCSKVSDVSEMTT